MLEKEIERELVKEVKSLGGLCWKFTSPSTNGVPDRVVMLPRGRFAFIELKAPSKKLRPIQVKRNKQLKMLGVKVFVLDSKEMVKEVLHEIYST
ncbi:MAG: VRR-NUC domain-containing protein [Candidatus Enterosoma sp.]|nr:VRR-NUC domain-containing protein [Candidatus Enterosoma sp.]